MAKLNIYQKIGSAYVGLAKNWQEQNPPLVPSDEELRYFKKMSKGAKRICIFGSTPQLRDLSYDYKAEVTVVDIKIEMIYGLLSLMKNKDRAWKHEIWVRGNWIDVPLETGYYDAILGDWTYCNLPFSDWLAYIKQSYRLLKRGGVKITRIYSLPKVVLGPDHCLDLYKKNKQMKAEDLIIYLLHSFWNRKDKSEKALDVYNYLERKSREDRVAREVYSLWNKVAGKGDFIWWAEQEEKQIKLWRKYFKIVGRFAATEDHSIGYINPVYVFKKR